MCFKEIMVLVTMTMMGVQGVYAMPNPADEQEKAFLQLSPFDPDQNDARRLKEMNISEAQGHVPSENIPPSWETLPFLCFQKILSHLADFFESFRSSVPKISQQNMQ